MGVGRLGPAECADDRQLAEGVVEVVVAADDVSDPHVMIVDHDREHIGRGPIGAEQDKVVELGVLHRDSALDEVFDHRLAFARGLEPDHRRGSLKPVRPIAPFARQAERTPLGLRRLTAGSQFLGREEAAIGMTSRDQLERNLGMAGLILRLEKGVPVTFETEP